MLTPEIISKLKPHQQIPADLPIEINSVGELFDRQLAENKNSVFAVFPGINELVFSYGQVNEYIDQAIYFLQSLNLTKGDKVSLIFYNSFEFIVLYFALLKTGIVAVPVNPDISPAEMLFIIKNSGSKVVFYLESPEFKSARIDKLDADGLIICPVSLFPGNTFIEKQPVFNKKYNLPVIVPADDAVIIYTSGTTGKPKGVVLNHLNLLSDAWALGNWFKFDKNTRTLCILPLFHNNGQVVTLLAPMYYGGSTVIVKGKEGIMAFWGLVKKYNVNWTSIMASILSILLSLPQEREDGSLTGIICGGQVLTPNVQNEFEKRFRVPVFEGFGLTETTSFACFNDFPAVRRKKGSVGMPLPVNEMKIMDQEGNFIPAGEEGEIVIRGFNVATEYFGLKEKNEVSFREGWFHSGDYGYMDEEGYCFFKGRKDFLIIKGGENIYPAEIENVIFLHPDVEEVAVIGIPDKFLGQEICAFVKLKNNSETGEKDLMDFCKDKIAGFKQPKKILIINKLDDLNDIPKGPTKKVLYNELLKYWNNKKF